MSVIVLEKEARLAAHQTGRNSGVIHAGVYYAPGSLKARFCVDGARDTLAFAREYAIPFEQCGKLIVATGEDQKERLKVLHERSKQNGLETEMIGAAELKRREPNIRGTEAVYVPSTGIVDYTKITEMMAKLVAEAGGSVITGCEVQDIQEGPSSVTVKTQGETVRARHLIACAGVMADRLTRMCGLKTDFRIVPFRGEYYRLAPKHDHVVRHLIYPVPDPALPFLGVHLTRMIGGYVTVGPNAVLAFGREAYLRTSFNVRDVAEMVAYPGFRKVIRRYFRSGADEMWNSISRRRYLALCQRYCPGLELSDLEPYRAGIRAQAVLRDGTLLHDFLIEGTQRTIHVCNAPSPAATSAMPIARHIVDHAVTRWSFEPDTHRVPVPQA
ncbi:hydroxyglutarate oxidase [Terrihabitans soli]|uniref:Hydroxyglutarate oxidase n=1 Tax=Terrihabitans soli TaxID=708113 RepID=A0A6S6QN54_9HYPH|nr:hydroxyglutarate oxidase [Terrihabitans soli]